MFKTVRTNERTKERKSGRERGRERENAIGLSRADFFRNRSRGGQDIRAPSIYVDDAMRVDARLSYVKPSPSAQKEITSEIERDASRREGDDEKKIARYRSIVSLARTRNVA